MNAALTALKKSASGNSQEKEKSTVHNNNLKICNV